MNGLPLNQIRLGPRIPLGRMGCTTEAGLKPYTNDYYDGTPLKNHFDEIGIFKWHDVRKFIKVNFVEIVSICRKSHLGNLNPKETSIESTVQKLIEYKVLDEELKLNSNFETFGNLFECLVGYTLFERQIQILREAKVVYPFPNKKYDPDGQKYDILAALDISKLLWIECKKPLYLDPDNPLGQVLSKENITKFIKRAFFLKPNIAIYLVDTKENYSVKLKEMMNSELLTSGNYIDYFEESDNIIARLNGFIYFNRINYRTNSKFYSSLKNSISQVLYDYNQFNGNNFNEINI